MNYSKLFPNDFSNLEKLMSEIASISSWQQVDMHHFHAMSLVAWLAGKQYMRTFYKELNAFFIF